MLLSSQSGTTMDQVLDKHQEKTLKSFYILRQYSKTLSVVVTTSWLSVMPTHQLESQFLQTNAIKLLKFLATQKLHLKFHVSSDPWLWHQKLGHTIMHALEKLSRLELVISLPKLKFEKNHICDACQMGKQTHSSFEEKDIVSTSKPLQLLYMDLFGPTQTDSIGGKRYAFVIVDNFSRFTWVIFLTHKNEAFANFEAFCRRVQREAGYFITTIHSDHGGEFENKAFEEFCGQNDFIQNFSSPRSPQQNEVVERKKRSLQDTTRTILLDRSLLDHF